MLERHLILMGFVLAFAPTLTWSDISLPKIFADHMVVQQNANLRIFGTSTPHEKLTVKFGGKSTTAVANQSGQWSTSLLTGSAGGPFDLKVASEARGGAKVIIKDILVGEVWLCCGQDNMQSPVGELEDSEFQISDAKNYPNIRLFNVKDHQANQPLDDFANVNPWLCCSSESIEDFSALGFLFGKRLNKRLDVPIGLVDVSRDGITLEAWTPYAALQSGGPFNELLEYWREKNEPNNPNSPSNSFNGMISPLTSFPVAGVIWFQGEANVGRGAQYAKMFPVTIESWRSCFKSPKLPFYFVQPAAFRYENFSVESLPEIWDAQLNAFKSVPNTGMVVSADVSDRAGVNIKNKKTLANRLANWAFAKHYSPNSQSSQEPRLAPTSTQFDDGQGAEQQATPEVATSGPIFESAVVSGNQVIVSFRFAKNGLKLKGTKNSGVTICGSDNKFLPATTIVDGTRLIVSHPQIDAPVAVRYGWVDTLEPTLTNSIGLPASPFRTDNFPLVSEGKHF